MKYLLMMEDSCTFEKQVKNNFQNTDSSKFPAKCTINAVRFYFLPSSISIESWYDYNHIEVETDKQMCCSWKNNEWWKT